MNPEIPDSILKAASEIDLWAKKNRLNHYEIGPVCSRSHADMIRQIRSMLEVDLNNVQISPSGKISFYGFPKYDPQPKA